MRRTLDRALGPAVETMLRRLERTVSPDEHRRLAAQRLEEPWGATSPSPAASALLSRLRDALESELGLAQKRSDAAQTAWDPTLAEALDHADDESAGPALPLHLLTLTSPELPGEHESGAWDTGLTGSARFEAIAEDRSPVAPPGLVLLVGLRTGRVGASAAQRTAQALASGLEPKHWFPRAGAGFGTANLLRCLLATAGAGSAYTADVCERLLRHVEVRRDQALEFRSGPAAATWQAKLERLRFTHALLDASEIFRDLRFLNAALKLNDRHHSELPRSRSTPGGNLLGVHYAASVARQESLLRSFFP